LSPSCRIAN